LINRTSRTSGVTSLTIAGDSSFPRDRSFLLTSTERELGTGWIRFLTTETLDESCSCHKPDTLITARYDITETPSGKPVATVPVDVKKPQLSYAMNLDEIVDSGISVGIAFANLSEVETVQVELRASWGNRTAVVTVPLGPLEQISRFIPEFMEGNSVWNAVLAETNGEFIGSLDVISTKEIGLVGFLTVSVPGTFLLGEQKTTDGGSRMSDPQS